MTTLSFISLKNHLIDSFAHGINSHAYCIAGPEGVGKKLLVEQVIKQIYKTPAETVGNYFVVSPLQGDEKTATKKDISIEQIKSITGMLSGGGTLFGSQRVIVITPAERMSASAANSLLKMLEEPPANTTFFILTTAWQHLPQTIVSRTQLFGLGVSTIDQMATILSEFHTDAQEVMRAAKSSFGLLGDAYAMLLDPELRLVHEEQITLLHNLLNAPLYQQRKLVEPFLGSKKDHTQQRQTIAALFRRWYCQAGEYIHNESALEQYAITREQLTNFMHALTQARHDILHNIHPKLVFDSLFLTLYGKS